MITSLITSKKEPETIDLKGYEYLFHQTGSAQQCLHWHYTQQYSLDYFVHEVSRKPKNLCNHIQRIFFCYHENLSEQLFASLLDFFLTLDGAGHEISIRMFQGTKSRLLPEQINYLIHLLKGKTKTGECLQGVRYSVLDKGLLGTCNLISRKGSAEVVENQDPLSLARDYIEYSQLDQARVVLEKAIMENSGNKNIHEELLIIYHSTDDVDNFHKMYHLMKQLDHSLLRLWEDSPLLLVDSIDAD